MPETVSFYEKRQNAELERQIFEQEQERLKRLSEPESPAQVLGNLALTYFIGGALGHGAVMPQTEALAVEGVVATAETADRLRKVA